MINKVTITVPRLRWTKVKDHSEYYIGPSLLRLNRFRWVYDDLREMVFRWESGVWLVSKWCNHTGSSSPGDTYKLMDDQ